MDKFTTLKSVAAPVLKANVDTDIITPMRRMAGQRKQPLHHYAFEALRYLGGDGDTGEPNPEFGLNYPYAAGARIMLTGPNFGCGSSRETAPEAIAGLGIRCLVGTSFGDIFFKNCFQQGILPISLDEQQIERLAPLCAAGEFIVDLEACLLTAPSGEEIAFDVNPLRRRSLLLAEDDIDITLTYGEHLQAFRAGDRIERPWVYQLAASAAAGEIA